ncbi:hypothetical protein [Streptomyces sp. ISL-86]|uniref:hypothetical protein n=1 Tax=Streptomyces sp. ISL-86 TaxID=2819187 RepID=UPI001BEA0233|nr:hypothetical protein [Streptomyces sp. ISL-86]MBT2459299.1 hypothetical protein [Streptomyces sp. ISL-86]
MSGLRRPGDGQEHASLPDEIQAKLGKRLDDVAKILAGTLVTVAGVMTALGLTSDVVFVALNNESWPIYVASLCAILAIVCSIVALLIRPTRRGNMWETAVLILGVIFYMVALSVAVVGAAKAAGGNGRPSIIDVSLTGPRSDARLRFGVHADGVDTWATVEVYAYAVDADGEALASVDFFRSNLRPNDRGVIEHRVDTPVAIPAGAWGIAINAVAANGSDVCETLAERGPTCVVIQLP